METLQPVHETVKVKPEIETWNIAALIGSSTEETVGVGVSPRENLHELHQKN